MTAGEIPVNQRKINRSRQEAGLWGLEKALTGKALAGALAG